MLSHPQGPKVLAAALQDLMAWLRGEGIAGAVIGGVAASILGKPRMTRDVDAVILADDIGWDRVLASSAAYRLAPRVDDPLDFARRTRILLLRHVATGVDLDISLGALPFERETVERSTLVDVGSVQIQMATAEDVIVMKALARRPRDIADIEGILDVRSDLDLVHIRRWLREFSSVLEMPEIQEDFERLLRRKPTC